MTALWLNDALVAAANAPQTAEEHGCPIPSAEVVALAEQVLRALAAHPELPAPHVCPGADPGIGITMRRGDLMVFIEANNEFDGEESCVVFCASNKKDWPKADQVEPEQFAEYAADAARFLLEGVPVPWEGSQE
jgi:hypothetical protein